MERTSTDREDEGLDMNRSSGREDAERNPRPEEPAMSTSAAAITNVEQHELWNGDSGRSWVRNADRLDHAGRHFGELVLDRAELVAGDHVLDVGCGNGATTRAAGRAVGAEGHVVGLDLSAPMLQLAARRAVDEGLGNVTFRQADVQVVALEPAWADAVISRMGVMFFSDPVAAFANLLGGTRPGGRLAFACWRGLEHNPWVSVPMGPIFRHVPPPADAPPPAAANPGMFGLADDDRIRQVLAEAGWSHVQVHAEDGPISIGPHESVDDVVAYLLDDGPARHLVEAVDDATRAAIAHDVAAALRPFDGPDGVVLQGGAWLVTATAPG
jgi:SAM-dependent methyltransferase